jgi:hypothetical protein
MMPSEKALTAPYEKGVTMKSKNPIQGVEIAAGQTDDAADEREVDLAAKVLAAAHHEGPITQAEMDAVRWKIDWHMVPMLFVCLQLSGWDKVM